MTRLIAALTAATLAAGMFLTTGSPAYATETASETTVTEMVLGAEDAPVTMVEYASFTCPHCASFHSGPFKELKKDYIDTGKVKFIYREVYFDKYGLWASLVARCGGEEKFFGVIDLIYKGQREWARGSDAEVIGNLRKIGLIAGLETEQLDACLQDRDQVESLIGWYQENAERDGITGTPSFVLNGTKVANQPYEDMKALIEAELE
jgi:protein-disulfide isomerase